MKGEVEEIPGFMSIERIKAQGESVRKEERERKLERQKEEERDSVIRKETSEYGTINSIQINFMENELKAGFCMNPIQALQEK